MGAVENNDLIKLDQSIAPINAYPYAKNVSPYLKSMKYNLQTLEH